MEYRQKSSMLACGKHDGWDEASARQYPADKPARPLLPRLPERECRAEGAERAGAEAEA
jgi:hypothetical protein